MDILFNVTLFADWFEANIMDGLLPFLFVPLQAFIMWAGDSQAIIQMIINVLNVFSP